VSGSRVYNQPIREAVEKWVGEDNSWSELADKLNWTKGSTTRPDVPRLKRSLGLTESNSYKDGERYTYFSKNIGEDNALAIIRAINRAPNEFDL
jgi:hypothetical protein